MKTYISILRGINVTGYRMIKMPELKKLYEGLGFIDVVTYIQSGNVIFKAIDNPGIKELSLKIEKEILKQFGYDVPVIIRTPEEMTAALTANPFRNADGTVADKIYITFLGDIPGEENLEKINPVNYLPDRFIILGKEIYLDCAAGYGTTKLSNTFFENKLKVRATTRNWKTVNALVELAKK
jgi:uncharacterized protein (DUF1697 family)